MITRAIDVAVGVIGSILTAPLIAVLALAIRLESHGNPIYTQTRVGKDGALFEIYKLRTMVSGAEFTGAGLAITQGDDRITRVGALLRRYSLDELPNLWNLVRGEMSIVGPRPTVAVQVAQYTKRQRGRLAVKPGITGWAQVNGRAALPWSERIELDLWYVEHRSLALDLRIVLSTVEMVFTGRGIYKGDTGGWSASNPTSTSSAPARGAVGADCGTVSGGGRTCSCRTYNQEDRLMAKAPRPLVGKVVAITGGARGIGRATAAALIAQGARVSIGDIDEEVVQRTAQELGGGTIAFKVDVTSRPSFEAFLNETEARLGPLDVLVNNAGIMPVGPFLEETDATAGRMVDINLHGVIYGSKLALARFTARRTGHLVNLASIAGKHATPLGATYAATKHGVVGLSESLRQEFRGTGVDVSLVMPVGVNTELYSGAKQLRGVKTPEPEDVAAAIVDALQTGRFDVYVPKLMGPVTYLNGLLPRVAAEAVARALGSASALKPDTSARAGYDARIAQDVARSEAAKAEAATPPTPMGES